MDKTIWVIVEETIWVTIYETIWVTLYETIWVTMEETICVTMDDTIWVTMEETIWVTLYETIWVTVEETIWVTMDEIVWLVVTIQVTNQNIIGISMSEPTQLEIWNQIWLKQHTNPYKLAIHVVHWLSKWLHIIINTIYMQFMSVYQL